MVTFCFAGSVAQVVEQLPFKQWVDGSSPSRATKKAAQIKRDFLPLCLSSLFLFADSDSRGS